MPVFNIRHNDCFSKIYFYFREVHGEHNLAIPKRNASKVKQFLKEKKILRKMSREMIKKTDEMH
jgi:hypothetical protein